MTCVYQSADELRATKEQLPHLLSICEYEQTNLDQKGCTIDFW